VRRRQREIKPMATGGVGRRGAAFSNSVALHAFCILPGLFAALLAGPLLKPPRPTPFDKCYMNCDSISTPTAVGGCLTDCTISPALPMPYNGGRVLFAPHASLPPGRRSWRLREMIPAKPSEQRWNTQGVHTERPLRRYRLEIGHGERSPATTRLKARFIQPCASSFTGTAVPYSYFTNFLH
jgi:hypothetical protein